MCQSTNTFSPSWSALTLLAFLDIRQKCINQQQFITTLTSYSMEQAKIIIILTNKPVHSITSFKGIHFMRQQHPLVVRSDNYISAVKATNTTNEVPQLASPLARHCQGPGGGTPKPCQSARVKKGRYHVLTTRFMSLRLHHLSSCTAEWSASLTEILKRQVA